MAHIHGVAWIEKQYLEEKGIYGDLVDHPKEVAELAKELISCKIPENDEELMEIVTSVQKHRHRKSCLKYGNGCRFNFPRLPCPETLVATPNPEHLKDFSEEARDEYIKEASEVLSVARDILENMKDNLSEITFEQLQEHVGIGVQVN